MKGTSWWVVKCKLLYCGGADRYQFLQGYFIGTGRGAGGGEDGCVCVRGGGGGGGTVSCREFGNATLTNMEMNGVFIGHIKMRNRNLYIHNRVLIYM